jgi:hypothetical protein
MLTRRQVLALGTAAGLSAMLGGVRSAWATTGSVLTPGHLRRSSWLPLLDTTLDVDSVKLRVAAIANLPQLHGREDAFRLELTGAASALPSGIARFRHRRLGSFQMFVSPVEAVVDGVQRYEVVVDRSVGTPRTHVRRHRRGVRQRVRRQEKIAS